MGDSGLDTLGAQREQQPLVAELALAPGDPFVVREVLQVDLVPVGERVPLGHGDLHGIVEDRRLGESLGHGQRLVVPVQDDRQVGVAAEHGVHPALRFQLAGPHAQRRMVGAQRGERLGEQSPHRGGERRQPQLADDLTALGLQIGLGEFDLRQDARRVLGEQSARVREPHPTAVLGQQLLADLALQLGHLLRDGRGRDVQPLGRTADRAVPGEGVEGAQALEVQHVSNATRYRSKNLACATRSCPPSLQP